MLLSYLVLAMAQLGLKALFEKVSGSQWQLVLDRRAPSIPICAPEVYISVKYIVQPIELAKAFDPPIDWPDVPLVEDHERLASIMFRDEIGVLFVRAPTHISRLIWKDPHAAPQVILRAWKVRSASPPTFFFLGDCRLDWLGPWCFRLAVAWS